MKIIKIFKKSGVFAEDKDIARELRLKKITPLLKKEGSIVLDFDGVESATQSFIHALISNIIREFGPEILDRISFKNCNDTVRQIIKTVVDYMQI